MGRSDSAAGPRTPDEAPTPYPGERFGFPREGPGSIASIGRRFLQILIDIALSWLAADAFAPRYVEGVRTPHPWASVLTYVLECVVLLLLGGQTAGMRLTGLRVVRLDGRPAGPVPVVVRTLLTLLLVPLLLVDRDLRGLHDRAAGVAVVRTRGSR
ncbi:MAG: RDD family protein [Frankiaceae bacterium]